MILATTNNLIYKNKHHNLWICIVWKSFNCS